MSERVDLDAAAARDERANKPPYSVRDLAKSQADVAALVAELRVAREVVEAVPATPLLRALADFLDMDDNRRGRKGDEVQQDLRRLANAYDDYFKALLVAHRQPTQEPGS
jgi:hypothetical protein